MVLITEEELKKRAEHNYGRLFDLEEVSLHQLNVKKIENLDKLTLFCWKNMQHFGYKYCISDIPLPLS